MPFEVLIPMGYFPPAHANDYSRTVTTGFCSYLLFTPLPFSFFICSSLKRRLPRPRPLHIEPLPIYTTHCHYRGYRHCLSQCFTATFAAGHFIRRKAIS
ncbi:hypothetical protein BDZ91DRAFT_727954 [Kalaharituber pfeilii]|nr:hypothetical protein BDZ91DRAFT_727954 [Kalaharituber pfeilii]